MGLLKVLDIVWLIGNETAGLRMAVDRGWKRMFRFGEMDWRLTPAFFAVRVMFRLKLLKKLSFHKNCTRLLAFCSKWRFC